MSRPTAPPLLGRVLLRLARLGHRRADVESDLLELLATRTSTHGRTYARRRFVADAFSVWRRSSVDTTANPRVPGSAPPWYQGWYQGLLRDVVLAGRILRHRPGPHCLVAITLALGIAGVTVTFSLADAILWHPLPYRHADRFVRVSIGLQPGTTLPTSEAINAWNGRTQAVQSIHPFGLDSAIVTVGGEPEAVTLADVSPQLLSTLGVAPIHGRLLVESDFVPGANVIVVGEALWRKIQKTGNTETAPTLLIEGVPTTVVGVMPQDFTFPVGNVAYWRPLFADRPASRVTALGVLPDRLNVEEASAIANTFPTPSSEGPLQRVTVSPFVRTNPDTANSLYVLMGAVGLVLLIAVANAAHVTVSEATRRDPEVALRAALGASWWSIARQFVTQTLLIAFIATAVAIVLSVWVLSSTVASVPYLFSFQSLRPIGVDWRALLCAAGVAVVSGLGAASLALARTRKISPNTALREQATVARSEGKIGRRLIALQLGVTLALLASAGTLGRSLLAFETPGLGVAPDHVVEVMVQLTNARLSDESALQATMDSLRSAAVGLPGVQAATIAYSQPPSLSNRALSDVVTEDGLSDRGGVVFYGRVDEGFFDTLGIRTVAGRGISSGDTAGSDRIAVVSQDLAERLWPGGEAIGHRFREVESGPWLTVVGVVSDVTNTNVDQQHSELAFYTPRSQSPSWWYMGLTVRTAPVASSVLPEVRTLVREWLPDAPIVDVMTGQQRLEGLNARARFVSKIITTFAAVALVLALAGVYGAFWYFVQQRTREMAVRLAVGASPTEVVHLVLASSLRLVAVGLAIGVPLGIIATTAMRSVAVGLVPLDPWALVGASILMAASAIGATYLPARRASRIDPLSALRLH